MKQRIALLSKNLENAKQIVEMVRREGCSDDNIYVVTKDDIILEDLPEADSRQYSDVFPAAKRGAGVGGALGLFAGILMATVPPAGIAVGGAAIAAMTVGTAAVGAWSSSLIGISLHNTQLEEYSEAIDSGATLILVDVDQDDAQALLGKVAKLCDSKLLESGKVDQV